jgi:hypothetical protein
LWKEQSQEQINCDDRSGISLRSKFGHHQRIRHACVRFKYTLRLHNAPKRSTICGPVRCDLKLSSSSHRLKEVSDMETGVTAHVGHMTVSDIAVKQPRLFETRKRATILRTNQYYWRSVENLVYSERLASFPQYSTCPVVYRFRDGKEQKTWGRGVASLCLSQ